MATADIVVRAKSIMYGTSIGEAPVLVRAAADAAEAVTGQLVNFTLDTNDSGLVVPGVALSVIGASAETNAHMVYVISKAGDVVTCYNSYMGSPAVADTLLDGAILEMNPVRGEWFIWQAVSTVFNSLLYPDVYKYNTRSVPVPDQQYWQNEVPVEVQRVEKAWQTISGEQVEIGFELSKNLPTEVSSTGTMLELYTVDGSEATYTAYERWVEADAPNDALFQCIATGAAAIALGASHSETQLDQSAKDSQSRGQRNPASDLWRDFVTLRAGIIEDIAREVDWFEVRR